MKTAVSKSIALRELLSLNGSEMSHTKISTRECCPHLKLFVLEHPIRALIEDSSFNRLEMAVELLKKYSCITGGAR